MEKKIVILENTNLHDADRQVSNKSKESAFRLLQFTMLRSWFGCLPVSKHLVSQAQPVCIYSFLLAKEG